MCFMAVRSSQVVSCRFSSLHLLYSSNEQRTTSVAEAYPRPPEAPCMRSEGATPEIETLKGSHWLGVARAQWMSPVLANDTRQAEARFSAAGGPDGSAGAQRALSVNWPPPPPPEIGRADDERATDGSPGEVVEGEDLGEDGAGGETGEGAGLEAEQVVEGAQKEGDDGRGPRGANTSTGGDTVLSLARSMDEGGVDDMGEEDGGVGGRKSL
ncbi:hypothetical protein PTTG_02532, partial [Puccinia triticina 1-1 BBBD Race 1]